jgi:hypothetical protein
MKTHENKFLMEGTKTVNFFLNICAVALEIIKINLIKISLYYLYSLAIFSIQVQAPDAEQPYPIFIIRVPKKLDLKQFFHLTLVFKN